MTQQPLNPYAIGKSLGGVMVPGARGRFGAMGLLQTTADLLAARPELLPQVDFSDSDDEVIRKAFEKIRDGLAVDRFLADPTLAKRFNSLCRKLGVRARPGAVNLRLLRLRKASGGGRLRPSTRREQHNRLIELFGPGVEAAMVKLSARYGASVDDVLAEPDLGQRFEALAREVSPGGTPLEYRLCALQIRKSRRLSRPDRDLFERLSTADIADRLTDLGSVDGLRSSDAPGDKGILVVQEPARPLFVGLFDDLRSAAGRIGRPSFVQGLAADSRFWTPDPSQVHLRFIGADDLDGSARVWELRLIRDWRPTFNWPVNAA